MPTDYERDYPPYEWDGHLRPHLMKCSWMARYTRDRVYVTFHTRYAAHKADILHHEREKREQTR